MIIKFPNGGSGYGLGFVPGEVTEVADDHVFKTRVMTTLVDGNRNPRGMDWRDQEYTVKEFLKRGVIVQADSEEAEKFKAAAKKAK